MVAELVGQARRRFLWNEILAQGAWAVSAAMGAVILLLLLGTQLLEWHWLIVLPFATLAAGVWRTLRRLPSRYAVAQLIDARLALSDTISTALYFDEMPGARCPSEPVREAQRDRAEKLSGSLNARDAVPFTMPRAVYAMALLGVAASSLFALRYGLERRLDLQRPLARILQQALGLEPPPQYAALEKKKQASQKRPDLTRMEGLSINESNVPGQLDAAPDSALDTTGVPDTNNEKNGAARGDTKNMKGLSLTQEQESESGDGEAGENADASAGDQSGDGQQGDTPRGQQAQNGAPQEQGGSPGSNSSLMSKFKDAMQNLLSRMRQQPAGAGGQQQSARNQNGKQGDKQSGGKQDGRQGQKSGGQESSSQDGQAGQDAQSAQNATGRGSSQGAEEQSTKQPGSGIGSQDGAKDVKAAEQLAAMGKISEIIGKRSASVSGEVTVEVQSNNQQLQTPYSQRAASHSESGAEINRDEVPVALQAYVQQYFEQVRKQDAPAARRGETAK